MGNMQRAWYANEVADASDINSLLQRFKAIGGLIHHSFPFFYVIDYIAQQYLVMTDEVIGMTGYHPRDFLESRMEKLIEVYHKDDFNIYNNRIFVANAAILQQVPQAEHHQYIFSYNFRVFAQDKKPLQLMQRSSFITSKETGLPLYSLGMIIDITDFKTDTAMVHTVEKSHYNNGGVGKERIAINYFYPNQEDTLLTRREKNVLQYLGEGYSSKQIADKLFTSERTVINHKQNMLRKTNTKNSVELVAFAIRNRLL